MNIIEFEDFEKVVMNKLLAGDLPILEILYKQYKNAQINERYFTGVGFVTEFKIPTSLPRIQNVKDFEISDILGSINGISVDFILFIRDGAIDFLEGIADTGPWPKPIYNFDLTYAIKNGNDQHRNLEKLKIDIENRKIST